MKKKLWKLFSQFIRLRDCLKTTGSPTKGRCYTCDRVYDFKELQAGHFIPGRTNSVLFDEIGVRVQCYSCNMYRGGEQLLFRRKLVKEIGEEKVEFLENKRFQTKQYRLGELLAMYDYYKQEIENMRRRYESDNRHGGYNFMYCRYSGKFSNGF